MFFEVNSKGWIVVGWAVGPGRQKVSRHDVPHSKPKILVAVQLEPGVVEPFADIVLDFPLASPTITPMLRFECAKMRQTQGHHLFTTVENDHQFDPVRRRNLIGP
jgi:hypothetical protein